MKFNDLKISSGKKTSRVGRGISAGQGKTAGRGTKGQGARKSGGVRPGFEGGQMPFYMRIPKLRGFSSHRPRTLNVYTGQLDSLKKTTVDVEVLAEAGLIENPYAKVKLISKGSVSKKFNISLQAASAEAVKQVEKAGGKFQYAEQLKRPPKPKKEK